jgi:hypothetical protein
LGLIGPHLERAIAHEIRGARRIDIRILEDPELELLGQQSLHRIIESRFRNLPRLHEPHDLRIALEPGQDIHACVHRDGDLVINALRLQPPRARPDDPRVRVQVAGEVKCVAQQ